MRLYPRQPHFREGKLPDLADPSKEAASTVLVTFLLNRLSRINGSAAQPASKRVRCERREDPARGP